MSQDDEKEDTPVAPQVDLNSPEIAEKLNLEDIDLNEVEKALALLSKVTPFTWTSKLGNVGTAIEEWRRAVIHDMGGESNVSAMERIVIDITSRGHIMLDLIDQFIFDAHDQKIIDIDRKQAREIVMQRNRLADSLTRQLKDLGLRKRRQPKKVSDILSAINNDVDTSPLDEAAREELVQTNSPDIIDVSPDPKKEEGD